MKVQIALREFVKCVCYDSVWSTRKKKQQKFFLFFYKWIFVWANLWWGLECCTYNECFLKQKCIAFITCIIISLRMSCTHILLSLLSFFDIKLGDVAMCWYKIIKCSWREWMVGIVTEWMNGAFAWHVAKFL